MVSDELIDIVVSGKEDYKGWKCIFVGDGSIVMEKNGSKITGHSSKSNNWLNDAWKECKTKIDKVL
jgi:hypothetical protein